EVGQVAETVTVEANVERIQTSESHHGRVITMRDIDVLPQLGRTPIILAVFQPGVQINPGDVTFSRVNGLRQGSNNAKLDGIDVNDSVVPRLGLSLTAVNTDSIGEFRVVTNGGKAEYGRSAGGQVEMITTSGTNQWHGNAFDYLRNHVLHANGFFSNISRTPRPKFIQNIFGGSIGGPILKDRTFIFGNYQGRRVRQEIVRNRTVLTPEAKSGAFRWLTPGTSNLNTFNIVSNDPRNLGIDPTVAKDGLSLLPNPNNTDIGDRNNTAGFRFNNPNNNLEDQITIKGDHDLWSGHRIFYRHSWQRNSFIDSLNNADATFPGQVHGTQGGTRWGNAIGSDWTITPTIVNEARVGHQSASVAFRRPARIAGAMITSGVWTNPLNTAFAQGRNSPVDEITDNITFLRGRHTFKGGFNWRYTTQLGYNDAGIYANTSFGLNFGNSVPTTIGPTGGAISSADRQIFENLYRNLLGRIEQTGVTYYSDLEKFQAVGTPRVRNYKLREKGFFFQDDWKVNNRMTLNLGLRYEFYHVPFESNRYQGTVDQAAAVHGVSFIDNLTVKRDSNWYNNDWNNFAPRVGIVFDPKGDGRMAVRAHYGAFYDRIIGATTSLVDGNTPGFFFAANRRPNTSGTTDIRLRDGLVVEPAPAAPVLQLPATRSTSIVLFQPDLRTGYVHHFGLNVQRELMRNTVMEIGYIGTRGVKLFMDRNVNQMRIYENFLPAFKELQAFQASGTAPSAGNTLVRVFGTPAAALTGLGATNVTQGAVGAAASNLDTANFSRYAAAGVSQFYLRNYPQYDQVVLGTNDGRSWYDSFQASLRRQAGSLKMNLAYTWSKSIDNISVDGNGFTTPIDNYNLRLNKSIGDAHRAHAFLSSWIYTLPVGRGRRIGADWGGLADSLLGGWDIGVLNIWQSGGHFTVGSTRATASGTGITTWANYSGDRDIGTVNRRGDGVFFWTAEQNARFGFPGAGEIGTSGRNAFHGPRFFNLDLSLVKKFRIIEGHSVNFRWEAYNLLNNVNFGNPGTNLTQAATFGKVSAQVSNPRIMQFALRYDF
ncbi:MAG: TonB-dependent receptor domain-containing protein, partial [Bryobacteraceae bacterium]